jgi:hypothetical protein
MPTVTTVTVKAAAGDYSSLSAAEAGEQADLVSGDVQLDIECYSFDDTTNTTFNGWTTDATRYIRVFTPAAERHAGVFTTGKYRLTIANDFVSGIHVSEDYVRFEGIQINVTSTASRVLAVDAGAAASSDVRWHTCIFKGGQAGTGQIFIGNSTVNFRNCLAYGTTGAGTDNFYITFNSGGPTVNIDNCTIVGAGRYGLYRDSGTVTLRNCYVGNAGTAEYNGTFTLTTCMHSSADSYTGSTGSIAYDTNNFTNVTGGSEDLHLPSGSDLIDAGTDLSGTFTVDIDGETRSGTWDVGADELLAAGGIPHCVFGKVLVGCFGGAI